MLKLDHLFAELTEDAKRILALEGYDLARVEFRYAADLRYLGQAYELTVPAKSFSLDELFELFHQEHERTYGHRSAKDQVDLVNARLTARMPLVSVRQQFAEEPPMRRNDRIVAFDAENRPSTSVAVIGRADLDHAARRGPFVIEEYDCTCVVGPDQTARLDETGNIDIALEAR